MKRTGHTWQFLLMIVVTVANIGGLWWAKSLPVPPPWTPTEEEMPPAKGMLEQEMTDLNYFGVSAVVEILERRVVLAQESTPVHTFSREEFVKDKGFASWEELLEQSLAQNPTAIDVLLEGYQQQLESLGVDL